MSTVFQDAIANLLSPIGDLLKDPSVSEVMINGPFEIFIERKGLIYRVPNKFADDESLMASMRAVAQSVGRVIDADNPRLDARLPDGSRIAVVIPPMAKCGVTVAIRKFSEEKLGLKDLITFGSLSPDGARFLDCCMYLGKNTLVSGGTGSGKTTMLNVLGSRMPKSQRLLIIEDAAELQIKAEHVVRFETRKANPDRGIKEITIRDLMESALRLRPDRIIVGEVRGPEALDLLNAMSTGHDGSMGTVHANSPDGACTRIETLCLMGDTRVPPDVIKKMVGDTIQLIVQCGRYHDGGRRTSHISEVLGLDVNGRYVVKDIFRWIQTGKEADGKLTGEMVATGYVPSFFEEFVANKLPFPKTNFKPPEWATTHFKKAA